MNETTLLYILVGMCHIDQNDGGNASSSEPEDVCIQNCTMYTGMENNGSKVKKLYLIKNALENKGHTTNKTYLNNLLGKKTFQKATL